MLILPIKMVSCEEKEFDYIVEFERLDGSRIFVMIPKESEPDDGIFGLNLVTKGHYM